LDSDNDGLSDIVESGGVDVDADGQIDAQAGQDGIGQSNTLAESPTELPDQDLDGVPDHLDLDSDNDGVFDLLETQGAESDTDGDGQIDGFIDLDRDGFSDEFAVVPAQLIDTDSDGVADHLDLDSDNNTVFDIVEVGLDDVNNDGLVDVFVDVDADSLPDNVDVDATGGVDADGDGIDDKADTDFVAQTDTDLDGIIDTFDIDANGNGVVDSLEDAPSLGAAFSGNDTNDNSDLYEANNPDASNFASSGSGCAVAVGVRSSKDPLLLILALIASIVVFRPATLGYSAIASPSKKRLTP